MTGQTLLLSLRPEFAELVFAGTKKVELRRVRPRVQADDWILVYVSTPVKALVGYIQVARIIESSPASLWKKVRDHAGITRQQYNEYYLGAPKAYGIVLNAVKRLPEPLELSRLRQVWPDFHPPQCYRYLEVFETRLIEC
jgi:predicted transcriptional regulator